MPSELKGQIECITFVNDESGFTIARVKAEGRQDLVTVVGNFIAPATGEMLEMQGEWETHPKYGRQFKVLQHRPVVPATLEGIKKYLGSGLIRGLGEKIADRIVETFGTDTLSIIEETPTRLKEVEGVGQKRITMIRKAWEEQKAIREVMLFLQSHGVGTGYAVKIFKQYGERSISVVKANPYRLASDIFGIGFIVADRIARKIGVSPDSPMRVEAGVLYVLNRLATDGHIYYPLDMLGAECRKILAVDEGSINSAIRRLSDNRHIVIESLDDEPGESDDADRAVFLQQFHACETMAAKRLRTLVVAPKSIPVFDPDGALDWAQRQLSFSLAANQQSAVLGALKNKVTVVTGGPGTGKTTIIKAILKIFLRLRVRVMLAAPTGRAARRMSEATGHEALTIHRLLEFSFQKGGFQRNADHPLDGDLLVVDESSMIDTLLMHHLLSAIPLKATLVLVGDVHQLPSVGAGNVLNDIIDSGIVPVNTLTEIFRQAQASRIVVGAHQINRGQIPAFDAEDPHTDLFFIQQADPEKVLDIILELVRARIPRRFGLDPVSDIQVLTPMHRGVVGAGNLNRALQQALNPSPDELVRGDRRFRPGDKVMQIRNNYDKEVFNGDIGRIIRINTLERAVIIAFDGREILYDYGELDEIVLAYAVSVHKSQGSEYPAVVIPVLTQHYMLLQRNLIYTAVTRGRQLVVLVGTRKALSIGVRNNRPRHRYTRLKYRLTSPG